MPLREFKFLSSWKVTPEIKKDFDDAGYILVSLYFMMHYSGVFEKEEEEEENLPDKDCC